MSTAAAMSKSQIAEVFALKDDQLAGLMAGLGISDANQDAFKMTFTEVEWNQCAAVREAVKYLGFDARQIMAQFFKKAAENPIKAGEVATLRVGEATLFEGCDPKTDLMFFLNVFLERGNNVTKAIMRCDGAAGAVLKRKASAYGIIMDPGQNKTILGSKELTLSRIAQAFSVQTAAIIVKDKVPGKLKSKLFGTDIPLIMQHTVFSGIIPSVSEFAEDLREIGLLLNVEMTLTLASPKDKRKMATRALEDLLESSTQYVDAAINGNLIADDIRVRMLVKADVLTMSAGRLVLSPKVQMMMTELGHIRRYARHTYQKSVELLMADKTQQTSTPSLN